MRKLLISVSELLKFGATWINDKSKFKTTFNEVSLKLAINFLLDNCFFNFGTLSFLQIMEIPVGSDPVYFVANLFLHYHENLWLYIQKAYLLATCFILQMIEFGKSFQDIYPTELELTKESIFAFEASFFDL